MSGSLARFSVIVATDASGGISKDGGLPWASKADMTFFRDTTTGRSKNAVIMGRKTYETIPREHRPRTEILLAAATHCTIHRLRNRKEIRTFLSAL